MIPLNIDKKMYILKKFGKNLYKVSKFLGGTYGSRKYEKHSSIK